MLELMKYIQNPADWIAIAQHWIDGHAAWLTRLGFSAGFIYSYAIGWVSLLALCAIGWPLEQIRPIERHDTAEARAEIAMDYRVTGLNYFMKFLMIPFVDVAQRAIVVALGGGGWFHPDLNQPIIGVAVFLFYALWLDGVRYWNHRITHMVPVLWRMHTFHHSAERLTVITGARHYWMLTFMILPFSVLIEMLVKVPPNTFILVDKLLRLPDMLTHLNYKLPWHRIHYFVTTPQWHRIHHSVESKHFDKNFAAGLPLMDFLFGTAYVPAPDEYPDTGLVPGERPGVWESLLWPFRESLPAWMRNTGPEAVVAGMSDRSGGHSTASGERG